MTRWRVSINGEDPSEIESVTAAGAAALAEVEWNSNVNERRQVETLVVHRAERAPVPPDAAARARAEQVRLSQVMDEAERRL